MSKENNIMRTRKGAFKKGESITIMTFNISSKALFNLSGEALKLYMLFLLNGKKSSPNKSKFAKMMKKSPRSVDTYYKELKDKGFLKIVQIGYNRYKYDFDLNGNVDYKFEQKIKDIKTIEPIEEENIEKEPIKVEVKEQETPTAMKEFNFEVIETAKEITEFEDFAVLENVYWQLSNDSKIIVVNILVERYKKEEYIREAIEWVFEKIDKEELLNGK